MQPNIYYKNKTFYAIQVKIKYKLLRIPWDKETLLYSPVLYLLTITTLKSKK